MKDVELRRTYEIPLARKLGLGSNFTLKTMHGRLKAMVLGTVAPKTAIASLTLKLHFAHKRMHSENGKNLKIIEDSSTIETGSKGGSSGNNKVDESRPRL